MAADNALDLLSTLIAKAKAAGADAADAVLVNSDSLSVGWRLGKLERLERSESADLGLRVLFGKRQAMVSSSDRSQKALDELLDRAVAMAKVVPEDAFCGLADPSQLATHFIELDICDSVEPTPEVMIERARRAEEAARAVSGVSNSEGADAGWGRSRVALVASNGFSHSYSGSSSSISVSVIAGGEGAMERDYDYTAAVHAEDLRAPEEVGADAGRRAVRRLGGRKVKTQQVPVIFDPRVARGLLGHLTGAINGAGIARGTSFLKDKLGKQIFPKGVTILEDPHRQRGMRSKPCDGEGVANHRRALVEDGVLNTWLLDLRSARQLGLESTGHASRGTSSPPSPSATNVWIEAGEVTPAELIADIPNGFYITDLFGQGINGLTGDYSRGAAGFWIDGGELAFAVNEVTVAGNLKDIFLNLLPANDLELRHGMDAPTLRIDGLTIAGS